MGHYDCDECGNFDCICKMYEEKGLTIRYHIVSSSTAENNVKIFVSHVWGGDEQLRKKLLRQYINIPTESIVAKRFNLFEDPNKVLKNIL